MKIISTTLPEVKVIEPRVFEDERGFFFESWNSKAFADHGIDVNFVQDNHSKSARGVLRGIHYQIGQGQGKLVRVIAGAVFDVAVDLRKSSANYGKHVSRILSAENREMLWIPPGFGHGFLALENGTEFLYKCTELYSQADDRSVVWSDIEIGINWPSMGLTGYQLSAKDSCAPTLNDAETFS